MCDLPSLSQASKWNPWSRHTLLRHDSTRQTGTIRLQPLCKVPLPGPQGEAQRGLPPLICAQAHSSTTAAPQEVSVRAISSSWKLQTGPKTLKPNQSGQEVPLAPEHSTPSPSDRGSAPTADPPGQPASPRPASLPAPYGHPQGSPHPTQGADVPVLVTSKVGALDWQNQGPLWASRLPPFEHLQRRKGFSSSRCSPAGSGARLPSPCR